MAEGVWLLLDKSSTQSYCHDTNGEAWCLARSATGEVYLRSQVELEAAAEELASCAARDVSVPSFGGSSRMPAVEPKGFDFTLAARSPPMFSAFSNVPLSGVFSFFINLVIVFVRVSTADIFTNIAIYCKSKPVG
jgi:hypothetical protein